LFRRLPRLDRAAGKRDLAAVRRERLGTAREDERVRAVVIADDRNQHRGAAMFGRDDLDGGAGGEESAESFERAGVKTRRHARPPARASECLRWRGRGGASLPNVAEWPPLPFPPVPRRAAARSSGCRSRSRRRRAWRSSDTK